MLIPISGLCEQCQRPLTGKQERYCSEACRVAGVHAERMARRADPSRWAGPVRLCAWPPCRAPLPETPGRADYCSDDCRLAARRDGYRARAEARAGTSAHGPATIPSPGDITSRAALQRRRLIRQWAGEGYSSRQMSGRLGILPETVRRIARELRVDVPADRVMNKARRIDSNRIVRETAVSLEGLIMGAAQITLADIDPAQAAEWAPSLDASVRVLRRFAAQIKEMSTNGHHDGTNTSQPEGPAGGAPAVGADR